MAETVVCPTSDVPEGSVKRFEVGNQPVAVFNLGGSFYATDDECTHGSCSLAEGIVDGEIVECTMHFGAFNIKTGAVEAPPCSIPLRTYKVTVRDDQVVVDLDKEAGE